MPWRCLDYIIQKGAEKIGVPYLPDRCAQLTVGHNGHLACHYCGNCSRGSDVGSFFSPTWFTIPEAEATKNVTLLTNALVRSVIVDENGSAKGVAYVDRSNRKEVEAYAKVVVLAAACVETAHIMLNSKSRHWPTGIANSSGQIGRNLCDHLYGTPGYGYLPQLLGQPSTPDNIADSTIAWMPRWQNLNNPREEKFIRGYSVYMGRAVASFLATTIRSKASARRTSARSNDTIPLQSALSFRRRPFPVPRTTSTLIRRRKISLEFPSSGFVSSGARTMIEAMGLNEETVGHIM